VAATVTYRLAPKYPFPAAIYDVKAAVRWRGGYGSIAKHAIHVDTPGLGATDLRLFDYKKIRRPIFPLDPETTWEPGKNEELGAGS